MGVLPLVFRDGQDAASVGLKGDETFEIAVPANLEPRQSIEVKATRPDGSSLTFDTVCRVDTPVEVGYYRNGGILNAVLRKMAGR
jgi:aconitate hydratase